MGTPNAAVPSLEKILQDGHEVVAVYTQPDRPSGRGNKIAFSPVKEFALGQDIPVFQPLKVKTPEALAEFKSHNADAAVVVAYGRILPQTFLDAYPNGAINVHFSLLPKYRGAAPVNWAIVNGETRTGVTTMQMDAGLDTGDILLTRATEIGSHETAIELMERLSFIGADLLSETLATYNELSPQPQDHENASFAPIMKREDGLIRWERTASEINNRIRGFQPFPGSFSFYRGHKVTIWKADEISVLEIEDSGVARPGGIVRAKGDNLLVACGNETVLRIEEIQSEGKRKTPVRDFINGIKPSVGESFG